MPAPDFSNFVDADDAWMIKASDSGSFSLKPSNFLRLGKDTVAYELYGDESFELSLPRAPDNSHSTTSDFVN